MARGVGGHSPANIQRFLGGVEYPANKQDLLQQARDNQAPPEVLDTLEHLRREQFGGPQDVMKAYGEIE